MDPYRGTTAIRCARCREALERTDFGQECPRGHGLWDPEVRVVDGTPAAKLGHALSVQLHPGRCPSCRKTMQVRRYEGVTYDVCDKHGQWATADHQHGYIAVFGVSERA